VLSCGQRKGEHHSQSCAPSIFYQALHTEKFILFFMRFSFCCCAVHLTAHYTRTHQFLSSLLALHNMFATYCGVTLFTTRDLCFLLLQRWIIHIRSPANWSWDLIRRSQVTGTPLSRWNVKLWAQLCHRPGWSLLAPWTTSSHRNMWPVGHAIIVRWDGLRCGDALLGARARHNVGGGVGAAELILFCFL